MGYKILVINLGSTSTKVAVYEDSAELYVESINHTPEDLKRFSDIWEQIDFREEKIAASLENHGFTLEMLDCVITRGGCCRPLQSGIYVINQEMLDDLRSEKWGVHPTGLGSFIADKIGKKHGIPAILADPPITDEFCELARFSGIKEAPRISSFHALNQKRTAKKVAAENFGRDYTELNMIVCHLGGGISIGAHEKGKVIDVNNALDGEGPFSPERAGTILAADIIHMCFSGQFTENEMMRKIKGGGGLVSYLGTNNGREVEERVQSGDAYALQVIEAMVYQVCKEIGACACVLKGKVDAVVLTGSLAYWKLITGLIKDRVEFIAPLYICPGENEMISLAENAARFLYKQEEPKNYP
ncbi:MAG: butyrate kinase [Synergistaceae bacterium]|nr:butyrate kinase [Synergistaceae bacterium]